MPQFAIEYTKTEVTRERTWVEADTLADAIAMVAGYEHDNDGDELVASFDCTFSDVRPAE